VVVGRLPLPDRWRAVLPSRNKGGVVAFKGGEFGGEELAFRDKDDVEAGPRFVPPVELSRQALGSVANDRASKLACGSHPDSACRQAGSKQEDGHEAAAELQALLINSFEIRATAYALVRPQRGFLRHSTSTRQPS